MVCRLTDIRELLYFFNIRETDLLPVIRKHLFGGQFIDDGGNGLPAGAHQVRNVFVGQVIGDAVFTFFVVIRV